MTRFRDLHEDDSTSGPPRQAPSWLEGRLETETHSPYDPSTWDGLYLSFFNHFFPPQQQFIVEFKSHVAADLPGEASWIPDFVVSKVNESGTGDRTLVIVETRRPGHEGQDFQKPLDSQLARYMMEFAQTHHHTEKILGLWISGVEVWVLEMSAGDSRESKVISHFPRICSITGSKVYSELYTVAATHWNPY